MTKHAKWTPERESFLGKASDKEVAGKLGFTRRQVRRRRELLGIPPYYSESKPKLPREGYVYLVCTSNLQCKIGLTANPLRRVRTLQRCCPIQLELKHLIKHGRASQLERELQDYFTKEGRHLHDEWFQLTEEDLSAIAKKWPCASAPKLTESRGRTPRETKLSQTVFERHVQEAQKGYPGLTSNEAET